LLGNHDIELSLPQVRRELRRILGADGPYDFEFFHDGEAYLVGDVLIEHGNRYDPFNVVDFDALRRYRSLLSRRQEVPPPYAFDPPAGSKMVAKVINPIKQQYAFIDLLKPESEVVVPLLLALEPQYRDFLNEVAGSALQTWPHRSERAATIRAVFDAFTQAWQAMWSGQQGAAMPPWRGDVASDLGSAARSFRADLGASPTREPGAAEPGPEALAALDQILQRTLGESEQRFFLELDPEAGGVPESQKSREDLASGGWKENAKNLWERTKGFASLVWGGHHRDVEQRLPSLLKTLRACQGEDNFRTEFEGGKEYQEAAEALARNGIRHIVFGHTHMPKKIPLEGRGFYLNSGTWADVLRFPNDILATPDPEALDRLRAFVDQMKNGNFSAWTLFRPAFVRLDLDPAGNTVAAHLCEHTDPERC
jgi:hypothetical protein